MRRAVCLCGVKFTAATTEAAWILLDAHCLEQHGDPFLRRGGENIVRLADRGQKIPERKR